MNEHSETIAEIKTILRKNAFAIEKCDEIAKLLRMSPNRWHTGGTS